MIVEFYQFDPTTTVAQPEPLEPGQGVNQATAPATHPEGCSNWLATDILGRAQRRFSRPIGQIAAEPDPRLAA